MAISSLPPLSYSLFSSNPNSRFPRQSKPSSPRSLTVESLPAKSHLLALISDQDRGLKTQQNPSKRAEIINAIEDLAILGKNTITTDSSLSGTWRMLWTTEKEQLFIIKNAGFFGTQTGDVFQVIDVETGVLNNVITFPPFGVFFVRSEIEPVPPQRVNFRFTSAVLRGKDWELPLPPFGQGWHQTIRRHLGGIDKSIVMSYNLQPPRFESVYLDEEIRVVKDIRGDYLVVDRAPHSWKE